jgi:lipid A 3-O-deacylase
MILFKKYNSFYVILILSLLLFCSIANAEIEQVQQKSLPNSIAKSSQKDLVTLIIENDSIGGGTDNNYTSGVALHFIHSDAKFPRIAHKIDKLIPSFEINSTSNIYYTFGQNIYTPRDTQNTQVDLNDRPWAGYLYGSLGMMTLTGNHSDEVEATIGVIGPASLAEHTQKFVHKYITDSDEPMGWDNQLKNEPVFSLAWQRSWPRYISGELADGFWSIKPHTGLTVGTLRSYAAAGASISLRPSDDKWQDNPIRVRPTMPGTGLFETDNDNLNWNLFAGIEGRAVANDVFLDGNNFTTSYSVDKKPFVADASAGISFTLFETRMSYTLVYRTKEFETQDSPEVFGTFSVGMKF